MGGGQSKGKEMSVELYGFNCPQCKNEHAGKSLAYICIGHPCPLRYCEGCESVIDPETCGCGNPTEGGGHDGHMIIPMGCGCYRAMATESLPDF